MTRRELRELIRSTIKEWTGTGAGGGGHMSMKSNPSQRIGGSFKTAEDEMEFYSGQNSYRGGKATSGMEPNRKVGNPNRQWRDTRY
jgi:hypothetical protein